MYLSFFAFGDRYISDGVWANMPIGMKVCTLVQLLLYFGEKAAVRTGLVAKSITSPEMFRYRCSQYMRIIFCCTF